MDNHYNDVTLNLESKDIMDKAEVNYNDLKDKLKTREKTNVEDPILTLKSGIKELKAVATITKKHILFQERAKTGSMRLPIG